MIWRSDLDNATSPYIADRVHYLVCLVAGAYKISTSSGADSQRLHLVNYFFKLDPLVALVNLLAGHALALALIVVARSS
jgi:hypothetical protein